MDLFQFNKSTLSVLELQIPIFFIHTFLLGAFRTEKIVYIKNKKLWKRERCKLWGMQSLQLPRIENLYPFVFFFIFFSLFTASRARS